MTTIAYKDGVIARDSRAVDPTGFIVSDKEEKMREQDGVKFFCFGRAPDIDKLMRAYFGEMLDPEKIVEANAFAVDGGCLYTMGVENGEIFKNECMKDEIYSFGSGGDVAMGAMEAGCSAVEAVEIAKRRDSLTGGEVKTFILDYEEKEIF